MVKNTPRREDALTRERIIEEAIALLDSSGEAGLTFRALAERLATGAGALYWHIANKNDLVTAACDAIVARSLGVQQADASPQDIIRVVALELFDVIDAHPWVGPALTRAPWQTPLVRILERLGQQIRALGIPQAEQFAAVSALLGYILGVSVQNAANAQTGKQLGATAAPSWGRLPAPGRSLMRTLIRSPAASLRSYASTMTAWISWPAST